MRPNSASAISTTLAKGPLDAISPHTQLITMTQEACRITQEQVSRATEGLAHGSRSTFLRVREIEERLDGMDREIDQRVTAGVTQAQAGEARELLACMKLMIDLERIGDLVLSFAVRAEAIRERLDMTDMEDLIRMACLLEKMLGDICEAFATRNVERALHVLRTDSELDRLRNLLFLRHTEGGGVVSTARESVQVLFIAQALERAGDHAKNLAEEICHLVSGRTMRHLLRARELTTEQLFLKQLRQQHNAKLSSG